jgi:hypothetical protein
VLLGIASGDWLSPKKSPTGGERWGGAGWVRIGQYVSLLPMPAAVGVLVWNRTHFSIQEASGDLFDPDVIIMQRLMHEGIAENISHAQAYGQKIINDVDDWFWGLSPSNKAFDVNHPKNKPTENIYTYKTSLHRSNLITVSTPYLADRFVSMGMKNVQVVKNTVDVSRFTPKKHTDTTTPLVGWVGSTNHRSGDLETMKGILSPMSRSGKIGLYHGGHMSGSDSFASRIGAHDSEVLTAPICPHDQYPNLLTMDIGIVPLSNTPFNQAKSDIKGLEYAAAGIPFVAQNLDAYTALANDLGVGRVAKNPSQWIKHIEALRDPEVRKSEGEDYREVVRIGRDIKTGLKSLIDIIESI